MMPVEVRGRKDEPPVEVRGVDLVLYLLRRRVEDNQPGKSKLCRSPKYGALAADSASCQARAPP